MTLALGVGGLNAQTAQLDPSVKRFYEEGRYKSPFVTTCQGDPWRIPFLMEVAQQEVILASDSPHKIVAMAGRFTENGSRRDLLGNPALSAINRSKAPGALLRTLMRLRQRGVITGDPTPPEGIPNQVQSAAATVLESMLDNEPLIRATWGSGTDLTRLKKLTQERAWEGANPVSYREWTNLADRVDMAYLIAASQDLAAAIQEASTLAASVESTANYEWRIATQWGDIVLSGGKENRHTGAILLAIDTGGNDTYVNNPTQGNDSSWFSTVIDSAGDDKYVSDLGYVGKPVREGQTRAAQRGKQGPASAAFGMTFLFDLAGKDLYRSAANGLGSGTFGVAYLHDRDGDDIYDAYADGIGFGMFGLGIVEDAQGNDRYSGFNQVQGVGLPNGVGWLIDRAGDDTYTAENAVKDFPSPQSAEHNVSMAQGAGNGVRLDYVNGRSLAGGIGLLHDLRGDDMYSCGVFGQGVGYWMGLGALWDADGNDKYTGTWYVQGSAAHFGIGYLVDDKGSDRYDALINMSQGAGHDFSIGLLLERAGNDTYNGAGLSLGAGNSNGIGGFFDLAGDDNYLTKGPTTLGRANEVAQGSLRMAALTLGVFFDGHGQDSYPASFPYAKNGGREGTRQANRSGGPGAIGAFVDQ